MDPGWRLLKHLVFYHPAVLKLLCAIFFKQHLIRNESYASERS